MLEHQPLDWSNGPQIIVDEQIKRPVAQRGYHHVVVGNADHQSRMRGVLEEHRESSGQELFRTRESDTQPYMSYASLFDLRDLAPDTLQRKPKLAHAEHQDGALRSQFDPLCGPLDQLDPQRFFQPPQAFAERRLAQSKRFRRPTEGTVLGNDSEVFDVAQFHGR